MLQTRFAGIESIPGEFGNLRARFFLGLAQRIGEFFGQELERLVEMGAVGGAKRAFRFQPGQALVHFRVTEGVAFFHGLLVRVGAGLPLGTDLAFPGFQVLQQLFRFAGVDGIANRIRQVFLSENQREAVTFEKQLGKRGFFLSRKTSFANGLNFAETMMGVVDTISLINGNKPSPFGVCGG